MSSKLDQVLRPQCILSWREPCLSAGDGLLLVPLTILITTTRLTSCTTEARVWWDQYDTPYSECKKVYRNLYGCLQRDGMAESPCVFDTRRG